jgi:hypothetical protein
MEMTMNTRLIFGELIRAMARAQTGQELNEIADAMFNARTIIDSIKAEARDDACAGQKIGTPGTLGTFGSAASQNWPPR